jgi:hypothetical protein
VTTLISNHHGIYIVNDLETYSLCTVPMFQSKRAYHDPENGSSEYKNEGLHLRHLQNCFRGEENGTPCP